MRLATYITRAALALSLTLPTSQAVADPSWPASVAEARAQLDGGGRLRGYRIPPTNVRAEDYRALFGDTVMVIRETRAPKKRSEACLYRAGWTVRLVLQSRGH